MICWQILRIKPFEQSEERIDMKSSIVQVTQSNLRPFGRRRSMLGPNSERSVRMDSGISKARNNHFESSFDNWLWVGLSQTCVWLYTLRHINQRLSHFECMKTAVLTAYLSMKEAAESLLEESVTRRGSEIPVSERILSRGLDPWLLQQIGWCAYEKRLENGRILNKLQANMERLGWQYQAPG